MILRRAILLAFVAITACAMNNEGWEMHPQSFALPAVFVDSTPAQIQHACPGVPGVMGCAVRDLRRQTCFIYVEPNAPKWLAAHELYHCAGFNHS